MSLRILSYNILAGGEDRLPLIGHVIQKQQPDVVALLEARSRSNAEALAQQLGVRLTFGEANNIYQDHVAWLSRLPVIRAHNHRLPVFAKTLLEIEILWGEASLTLFAAHLKAGQDQEREQHRVAEMQAILRLLHAQGNQLQALVGDLNTIHPTDQPNGAAYRIVLRERGEEALQLHFPRQVIPLLLEAGYVDCYRALHPLLAEDASYTAYRALRFDYIFASASLAQRLWACDIAIGGDAERASDHYPIWAEFR